MYQTVYKMRKSPTRTQIKIFSELASTLDSSDISNHSRWLWYTLLHINWIFKKTSTNSNRNLKFFLDLCCPSQFYLIFSGNLSSNVIIIVYLKLLIATNGEAIPSDSIRSHPFQMIHIYWSPVERSFRTISNSDWYAKNGIRQRHILTSFSDRYHGRA